MLLSIRSSPYPQEPIRGKICHTVLILIKDQDHNRNHTTGKMSSSFKLHVDDCIHLRVFLPDFVPYGKNNKQWAVLCSLTDILISIRIFQATVEMVMSLWCFFKVQSLQNPFGSGPTSQAKSHFQLYARNT